MSIHPDRKVMMSQVVRPDVDIYAEIQDVIVHYPPLAHDRAHIQIEVKGGHVVVSGNMKSQPAYEYFLNRLPTISGVQSVDSTRLYHDDEIKRSVARLTPPGVFVNIEYGLLKLTGTLPEDISAEEVVKRVSTVPGIHRIVTVFKD
jgi:hypothetical protein